MKRLTIFLFILIPLFSCTSLPQSEQGMLRDEPMENIDSAGLIKSVQYSGTSLIVTSKDKRVLEISIPNRFADRLDLINSSSFYAFQRKIKPDGPFFIMELSGADDLHAWIGDGIRSGMGPEGLQILPGTDMDTVVLMSDSDKWSVPAENETTITWQNQNWIVYVSNVLVGTLQDQPDFAADVVILRQ